jgi:hypothetical protein
MRDSLGGMRHMYRYWSPLCVWALAAATPGCGQSQAFPGTVAGQDSAWIAKNDSMRAAFMAMDSRPSATVPGQNAALAAAFATALQNARVNMRGLGDPRRYCVSGGPPQHLRPVSDSVRSLIHADQAQFVQVSRCEADRALGIWIDRRQRAWLLWADSLRVTDDSATVKVGYHAEFLEAAGWVCTLRRTDAGWKPAQCRMEWIS